MQFGMVGLEWVRAHSGREFRSCPDPRESWTLLTVLIFLLLFALFLTLTQQPVSFAYVVVTETRVALEVPQSSTTNSRRLHVKTTP